MISPQKIDRLLKSIKSFAESDRSEALNLLESVKAQLKDLPLQAVESEENGWAILGLDSYTKLIQSACAALSQMGASNEKLIKLTGLIDKLNNNKGSKGKDESPGDLFSKISKLTGLKEDPDDD